MKTTKNTRVLMLLAIALMALISMQGCGLNDMDSKDVDLSPDEQMIKDGTHPILGSWRLYAFVSADGSSKVAKPTVEECKTCYTIVIKQDKTIEGTPTINEITGYFNLKNNTIKLWWATEAYTIEPEDERLLEEIVPLINKFKIEDDQLFLFYPENNYLLFHRTIEEP